MAIVCFVLVGVGVLMILLGAYMSYAEWQKDLNRKPTSIEQASVVDTLTALGKLAEAIKNYPVGQQLIVWGIVVIVIGGVFGGVSGLTGKS